MCEISFSASLLPVCVCASKIENGKITRMKRRIKKKPIEPNKNRRKQISKARKEILNSRDLKRERKEQTKKRRKKKLITGFWFAFFGVFSILGCVVFFLSRFLCFSSLFLLSCLQPLMDVFVYGIFFLLLLVLCCMRAQKSICLCWCCDLVLRACTRLFQFKVLPFVRANRRMNTPKKKLLKIYASLPQF